MNQYLPLLQKLQPFALGIAFVLIYLAEHIFPQRDNKEFVKHDVFNILIGVLNMIIAAVGGYVLQICLVCFQAKHWGLLYLIPDWPWVQVLGGLLLADVVFYWWHRTNHRLPFLWYFHRFHHLDNQLNSTSAVRFHLGEITLSHVFKTPLFILVGITPVTAIIYGVLLSVVIIFHHSNVRFSEKMDLVYRRLFVSPHMHRIHHSVIQKETDSNYGSVFPYWDHLFGTYTVKPQNEIVFGVDK